MGGAEERRVEVGDAVGAHLLTHEVPDLVEHAFVVDGRHRDPLSCVGDDECLGAEPIEHGRGLAVAAVASAQIDAVPPPVGRPDPAVRRRRRTVEERLARIEAAVSVRVPVWLLEREQVRPVECVGRVAVGRVRGQARRERRCDVGLCRTDEKVRGCCA